MAALGANLVKFASTYLLTRDREFRTSAKRLIGAIAVIFQEIKKGATIEEVVAKNLRTTVKLRTR